MSTPKRIAIVGIDGSGKSSVIARLLEATPDLDSAVIHCPTYHANPDAPLGALSRAIEAYSHAADELASFELKAAALYMQMTLYGPVERTLAETFLPERIVCERHPVVDTLAYGPFYQRMVTKPVDASAIEGRLEAAMERRVPGSYRAVRGWHARETRRLGATTSFWELPHEVCAQFKRPTAEVISEFSRRYRADLPEEIVLLDVDADEAQRRVQARSGGGTTELHETAAYLNALRASYGAALEALATAAPGVRVRRITTGDGKSLEACLDELVGSGALNIG